MRKNDGSRTEQKRGQGQKQVQGQGPQEKALALPAGVVDRHRSNHGGDGRRSLLREGLAAFQAGLTDVGIGYMVLTAVFPPGTATAGWWMGRGTDPREGGTD